MKALQPRELFEATRECKIPLCVMNVAGSAADNAADTVGWMNRIDDGGRFTREFIEIWYESVIGILSTEDARTENAVTWFAERGCTA